MKVGGGDANRGEKCEDGVMSDGMMDKKDEEGEMREQQKKEGQRSNATSYVLFVEDSIYGKM